LTANLEALPQSQMPAQNLEDHIRSINGGSLQPELSGHKLDP